MNDLGVPAQKSAPCGGSTGGSMPPGQGWQENRQSEIIWLRLSGLVKGAQRLDYLEKALQINPKNKQIIRLIERLNPKRADQVLRYLQESWDGLGVSMVDKNH